MLNRILLHKSLFQKGAEMKKRLVFLFFLPLAIMVISGCLPAIIVGGTVGALGGYAVSRDTIQGETDKPYDVLWNSAVIVARIRGKIKTEDSVRGRIELEAESSRVYIRLDRLTQTATRVRVSARKYHMPNIALAQDIFVKIMEGIR
jgi:hypothetical protein